MFAAGPTRPVPTPCTLHQAVRLTQSPRSKSRACSNVAVEPLVRLTGEILGSDQYHAASTLTENLGHHQNQLPSIDCGRMDSGLPLYCKALTIHFGPAK